ncbi:hypothetical protein BT96DRAFT_949905 [Gymnopus androsaceus JB14]|uniref:Uncharacterized protein n=1 Tax=Gymnopus androsaceus JB14 TaxID=1447944 RepID=A0A6A4GIN9_9AGAR|nr:hypothetical protein BT96DRAFT_949905 [Gymnopus androsaceus JB14]
MPREHTRSTIKKSKRMDAEQANVTKGKRIDYLRWNRRKGALFSSVCYPIVSWHKILTHPLIIIPNYRNKAAYNAQNKQRMRKNRAGLKDNEKAGLQECLRASSRKNRTEILQKAKDKLMSAHMQKFGRDAIWWYKLRNGSLRAGLPEEDVEG